ncbi:MAG: asparagine synthase (glutamine-hydrolyzing) [Deltaproteobacteria bacterium]|nr:asparagine synthase (glutamine-hydrolyzing) [Deltaproteobacteria bacterium]
MCGIAGFYSPDNRVPSKVLEQMTDTIAHRGPDSQGFWGLSGCDSHHFWKHPGQQVQELKLGLGFRRLSILDLSELASQPMRSHDGRYWIAFNGEIYNYVELRQKLPEVQWRTTGDTEVLLELLSRGGMDALNELNGIFSFALFDTHSKKLFLVRDHLGIKPLYYFRDARGIFFGSEIRSLLKAMLAKPSLHVGLVSRYLMTNWIPDPDTLFEGIKKLEPGHFLEIFSDGRTEDRTYWDLQFNAQENVNLNQWLDEMNRTVERTVERQLRSDVPVGFFLSGGIDSSLLASKAVDVQKQFPTTFTIGFKWSKSKEDRLDLDCARLLKKYFPFNHHEIVLAPSVVSLLPKVVETLEEPIADPAAICSYLICEAASGHFKVLISGQGGDELFGGYQVYQGGLLASRLDSLPSFMVAGMDHLAQKLPYSIHNKRIQNVHRLKKLFASVRQPWPEPFLTLRGPMRRDELGSLLTPETTSAQSPPFLKHLDLFENARRWDPLQQMTYLDMKTYLPALNLTYTDKTSMHHSIEVRVPFLDREMVSIAQRIPSHLKALPSGTKLLLKEYAAKSLPHNVVFRKKTGFGLPVRDWLLTDLNGMVNELLSPARIRKQKIFQPEVISNWLREHREMVADHTQKIYSLMTFQLWCEVFGIEN